MNLLFIIGFYPEIIGGAEYQARIIADSLQSKYNCKITFVSYGHDRDETCLIDGFKVYKLSIKKGYVEKMRLNRSLYTKIDKIIDTEIPEIIYQRVLNTISYQVSISAKRKGIPLIVHISDKYSVEFKSSLKGRLKRILFERIIHNDARIIVQTLEQATLLNKINITPAFQQYNFHPPAHQKKEHNNTVKKLFWIGSMRKVKRVELFLDLAKSFTNDRSTEFVLIGRLEQGRYGSHMHKRILESENIIYLGERKNDEINDLLETQAFCIINTSISEGFSNTFIQAWLRGIPVISLCADPDNLINKYKIGLTCNSSVEKMKQSIHQLISDKVLYNEISKNALDISGKLFTIDKNIAGFEKFLRNNVTIRT